jgi:hypothetical protein
LLSKGEYASQRAEAAINLSMALIANVMQLGDAKLVGGKFCGARTAQILKI